MKSNINRVIVKQVLLWKFKEIKHSVRVMQGFFHESLFHLSAGNGGFCLSIWLVTCSEGGWKGNLAWRNDVVSITELSPQSWYFSFKPSLRQAERSLQIALSDGNTVADDGCGWTPPCPTPFKTGGFNLNHLMRKFTPGIMRTEALGYSLVAKDFKQIHLYFWTSV